MKNLFLKLCYISNILLIVVTIMLAISHILEIEAIKDLLFSNFGALIRGVLALLSIFLWIYCIFIWTKHDKKIPRLLLIFFLSGIYIIFYFRRIIKKGWL